MPFRLPLAALVVLLLFGSGSIAAPALHAVEHAVGDDASPHHAHDDHYHGATPSVTDGISTLDLVEPCALCHTLPTSVLEAVRAVGEALPRSRVALSAYRSVALGERAWLPARGPPSRA